MEKADRTQARTEGRHQPLIEKSLTRLLRHSTLLIFFIFFCARPRHADSGAQANSRGSRSAPAYFKHRLKSVRTGTRAEIPGCTFFPRARLRILSRETVPAVPFRYRPLFYLHEVIISCSKECGTDPVQAIDPVQYRSHTSPRSTACPADYT